MYLAFDVACYKQNQRVYSLQFLCEPNKRTEDGRDLLEKAFLEILANKINGGYRTVSGIN